ncbi:MAG: hypothetical protein EPN84_05660 [Legionella sp.]|nr:MAG: hypothetical protein EPN84_05660 [Legionella sp.]
MNYLIRCCCVLLMTSNCYAGTVEAQLPANLIKVTKDLDPKCIEYVTYKGQMYCSTKPIEQTPVDPSMVSLEKQNIQMDSRPWKLAWGKQNGSNVTLEYIPFGDDINQWQELITTQFFAGLTDVSAQDFANNVLKQLQQMNLVIETEFLEQQPNEVIFEFRIKDPVNLRQDELQKVIKGKDGIYVLHYAIKKADMGSENRAKWLLFLKQSSLR